MEDTGETGVFPLTPPWYLFVFLAYPGDSQAPVLGWTRRTSVGETSDRVDGLDSPPTPTRTPLVSSQVGEWFLPDEVRPLRCRWSQRSGSTVRVGHAVGTPVV